MFGHGGSTDLEVLHAGADGDLAYWTGTQRADVVTNGERVRLELRVTELFRREAGGWKLLHRHADQLAEGQARG